jgi:hypothetical protein
MTADRLAFGVNLLHRLCRAALDKATAREGRLLSDGAHGENRVSPVQNRVRRLA